MKEKKEAKNNKFKKDKKCQNNNAAFCEQRESKIRKGLGWC